MTDTLAQNAKFLSTLSYPGHPLRSSNASQEFFFKFKGSFSSVKMRTSGAQLVGAHKRVREPAWAEGFLLNRGLARWSDFGTITPSSKALQNWPRAMSGGCIFLMKKLTENLAFPIGSSGHQFMFR